MFVLYSRVISILGQRADRTLSNLLDEISPNNARSLDLYESARKNASKVKKLLLFSCCLISQYNKFINIFNKKRPKKCLYL